VNTLPINAVAPVIRIEEPVPEFAERIRQLHATLHGKRVDS
jgi:hypothetical protein